MIFEQRMAELGVDLSDLSINVERDNALSEKYYELAEATADTKGIEFNALLMITLVLHDIAERDDIIDRMETRIVNLTGERDYLAKNYAGCEDCRYCSAVDDNPCSGCDEDYSALEFAGIPDDWRPDDDSPADRA